MPAIPKKVAERYTKAVPKFQRILKAAQDRDLNEADTVSIIQDTLAEVFGFEKYIEITGEYAIRGTFCDLAIKIDDKIQCLIEVKAIGLSLKEAHLKQVVDYGANHGTQWVVLTNGIIWELHKILFERPIGHQSVTSMNFLELNSRKKEDQEKLFLFSKKGIAGGAREEHYERIKSLNRHVIGAIILSKPVLELIRRDVRKLSSGLMIQLPEIEKILRDDVLKRGVIEGEEATNAAKAVRKLNKKTPKRPVNSTQKMKEPVSEIGQAQSN